MAEDSRGEGLWHILQHGKQGEGSGRRDWRGKGLPGPGGLPKRFQLYRKKNQKPQEELCLVSLHFVPFALW